MKAKKEEIKNIARTSWMLGVRQDIPQFIELSMRRREQMIEYYKRRRGEFAGLEQLHERIKMLWKSKKKNLCTESISCIFSSCVEHNYSSCRILLIKIAKEHRSAVRWRGYERELKNKSNVNNLDIFFCWISNERSRAATPQHNGSVLQCFSSYAIWKSQQRAKLSPAESFFSEKCYKQLESCRVVVFFGW